LTFAAGRDVEAGTVTDDTPSDDVDELRRRLEEAEETLLAIRRGEVDAIVVDDPEKPGEQVYTLRGADEPYRVFVEQMHEGAVTLTPEGDIGYCNHQFAKLVGRPLEDVIGAAMRSFVAESHHAALDALVSGRQGRGEIDLRTAHGGSTPVYVSASTMGSAFEDAVALIVTDLRDLRRAEGQRDEAEAASRAKDHFLAVLSHELRTPLTPVLTGISLLEKDGSLSARAQQYVRVLRRNVELEARLIDDLLDLTRIARGKAELDKRRVELRTIIEGAVEVCRADIDARRLHFGVDWGTPPYVIEADTARLQQVFWNLLKNAIKFTPPGGRVGIRCRRAGTDVAIDVNDSGIGIDARDLPRIFDAFTQAESSMNHRFGGLGLGLSISKGLVEMHAGSIGVHSDGKDRGATFTVRLPLVASDARVVRPDTAVAADVRRAGGLRILLVEDHGDTAELIASALELEGHHVLSAGDVATALQIAASETFDLLLSDLGLPDGTGIDVMRGLRSFGVTVPGIAFSGYGQDADLDQTRAAGFQAHILKPVDPDRLLEAIQTTARRSAA
jgi:PAS domain S-box-containing protein